MIEKLARRIAIQLMSIRKLSCALCDMWEGVQKSLQEKAYKDRCPTSREDSQNEKGGYPTENGRR